MKARDIMTPKPLAVLPTDDVCKAAELMRYERIGAVPVVKSMEGRRLVGLITDRDITIRCVARGAREPCTVGEIMTPAPLATVLPDANVDEIVRLMEAHEVRRIPVVSDDGALVGIIAEADLAVKLPESDALPLRKRVKQYSAEPHVPLNGA